MTTTPRRRTGLALLLAATAALYLWDLSASGWGNSFYAAAAQAGAQDWKAWLFGSLDAGNAITVDKPPAAMWVMGLSARIFGVNSWAILAPQALMGVASVALLHAAVRRWFGYAAGMLAGAALAVTPVAVLMFRYDNPDALLVLLMTAAAYTTVRATERASATWLALTGVLLGFGFLTKMMQAFLVLPAFALVYLVAAPATLGRRIRHLLLAGVTLIVSAGWYVALVSLWPASSRPYIAGSTNNSLWELALGYNGLGRILGSSAGSASFGGSAGIGRLFGESMGTEISWLLPAALIALVTVLAVKWTAPRTDRARAGMLLWGGWLLVTGVTFSFMSGTIHPYYTVALAPSIAAVTAIGARVLWLYRTQLWARLVLATMVLSTAGWGFVLLGRTEWIPALRWAALAAGLIAALALAAPLAHLRRLTVVAIIAALLSTGLGTAAYAAATVTVAHTGSLPASGPASSLSGTHQGRPNRTGGADRESGAAAPPAGAPTSGTGDTSSSTPNSSASSSTDSSTSSANTDGGTGGGTVDGAGGRPGGMSESSNNAELNTLLKAATTRWSAAVSGATSAADLELATGTAVIALGGWNGSDPSPTLEEFQIYVALGEIHYYIAGGGRGQGGDTSTESSEIAAWVSQNYTATTVGGTTVYDLTTHG
ncbi:4-amino-4-deoxy-L-arabinose transferase-like glycosyltransferase [Actinoplanes lutulentus]|nr:glycosyltransferase family 39 protein [Actinoplanes lutulentus]MBB2943597.1 4-amino-4-deoxy-L-arabinose transferase-like glycosyltransferase [Actinoplanes lutulentus]